MHFETVFRIQTCRKTRSDWQAPDASFSGMEGRSGQKGFKTPVEQFSSPAMIPERDLWTNRKI
jgi:hypothetical protein